MLAARVENKRAIGIAVLTASHNKKRVPMLVQVFEFRGRHLLGCGLGRRFTCEILTGVLEVHAVDMPQQVDNVAALVTPSAIPDIFCRVDAKAIIATADWTRASTLDTASFEMDSALGNHILNRNVFRPVDPCFVHRRPRSLSTMISSHANCFGVGSPFQYRRV